MNLTNRNNGVIKNSLIFKTEGLTLIYLVIRSMVARKLFETDLSENNYKIEILVGYKMFRLLNEQKIAYMIRNVFNGELQRNDTYTVTYTRSFNSTGICFAVKIAEDFNNSCSPNETNKDFDFEGDYSVIDWENRDPEDNYILDFPDDDIDEDFNGSVNELAIREELEKEGYEYVSYKEMLPKIWMLGKI